MHIHILGICGTFMGGVAALAKAAGHRVTGCDHKVYPPMSTQLAALGIEVVEGFSPDQLSLAPDLFVVGNVVSRGNPLMEAILDAGAAYTSGPQWLSEHVLHGKTVIAVAGTHGKTTTASLIAYLLDAAGQTPGFLIGGVPGNFEYSARLGDGELFVVEADEYDTAFFDKRAKFVHYRPQIVVLNNLEFDHADIYADLAAIEWQFHQLLRTVPGSGAIIVNAADRNLARVLAAGCWTKVSDFAAPGDAAHRAEVELRFAPTSGTMQWRADGDWQSAAWRQQGVHNLQNTAAAVAAVAAVDVPPAKSVPLLSGFEGVKRRLECIAEAAGICIYDDFAHHPTAIRLTIEGLLQQSREGRLLVAFEPRSNTMRRGVHRDTLQPAFDGADAVFVLRPDSIEWDIDRAFSQSVPSALIFDTADALFDSVCGTLQRGDRLVLMSNGAFAGLRERFEAALINGDIADE